MASTVLKRKARRNKVTSKQRTQNIDLLTAKPVIKNVDVEAIKAEFEKKKK